MWAQDGRTSEALSARYEVRPNLAPGRRRLLRRPQRLQRVVLRGLEAVPAEPEAADLGRRPERARRRAARGQRAPSTRRTQARLHGGRYGEPGGQDVPGALRRD